MMYEKLAAIEPVSLLPSAQKELKKYVRQVVCYDDIPKDEAEIAERISDADAVLLSRKILDNIKKALAERFVSESRGYWQKSKLSPGYGECDEARGEEKGR